MTNKRRWPLTLLTGILLVIALAIVFIPSEWYPESWNLMKAETATNDSEQTAAAVPAQVPTVPPVSIADSGDLHMRENGLIYQTSNDPDVICMYLTVYRGNPAENTDHSWTEVNTYSVYDYERMGVPRYQVAALLQVGDERGPLEGQLGYGESIPNATVQIRGQSSSKSAQKNYKVELKENHGTWNGQRTIALNKHQGDPLRFRNKLANELLQDIPQLMALRTQFVHLYVRDLTDGANEDFVDYGLFTQIEQLNKTALEAHGLSRYGKLYKINRFEFYRYEDIVMPTDDPKFDQAAMEALIENKTGSDNKDLIRMLDALNDVGIPADSLLDEYFDRENLQYWMAFEMLIANADSQNRNMYIYSPPNSNKWFIYPWDHDGALRRYQYSLRGREYASGWEYGVSNYWGNILFQRMLKNDQFRKELGDVMLALKTNVLTANNILEKANRLHDIVKPFAYAMPDMLHESLTPEQYDDVTQHLPYEIERSYELFLRSLEQPMPFYIGNPEYAEDGTLELHWDPSYDFDDETIMYTYELSNSYEFTDCIERKENLLIPMTKMTELEPGQYFIRITAKNSSGYEQYAFDYYLGHEGKVYGTKCFWVLEDGTIKEEVMIEG